MKDFNRLNGLTTEHLVPRRGDHKFQIVWESSPFRYSQDDVQDKRPRLLKVGQRLGQETHGDETFNIDREKGSRQR